MKTTTHPITLGCSMISQHLLDNNCLLNKPVHKMEHLNAIIYFMISHKLSLAIGTEALI